LQDRLWQRRAAHHITHRLRPEGLAGGFLQSVQLWSVVHYDALRAAIEVTIFATDPAIHSCALVNAIIIHNNYARRNPVVEVVRIHETEP
jgi:hypothetical protein